MTEWETAFGNKTGPEALNPIDVEKRIINLVGTLSAALEQWKAQYREHKEAEHTFDRALAKARLAAADAGIAANDRRYHAELNPEVIETRRASDLAEVAFKYADERLRAVRSALSAWQSVGHSVRQAYQNAGRGEF